MASDTTSTTAGTSTSSQSSGTAGSGTTATSSSSTSRRTSKHRGKGGKGTNASTPNTTKKFKGEVDSLATIGLKDDIVQTDNFLIFQRGITQYILSNFQNPGDIVPLARDLSNPMPRLMRNMPTLPKLMRDYGMDPSVSDADRSADDQAIVNELKTLLDTERKSFVTRKAALESNLPKLFGLIWGQCTPTLQQDIRNLPDYGVKADRHDCLWLLEHLKKCTAGTDNTQHP